MKKLLVVVLGILVALPAFSQVEKHRVSVAELKISDSISPKQQEVIRNSALIADIENSIRNGRKFELLTRRADAMEDVRNEQKFAKSDLAAGDAADEGQLSNAQSIVKVEVLGFNFGRGASKIPNIEGKYRIQDNASIELSVQIIDTTKGTVTASFPVKASSSGGSSLSNGVGAPNRAILDNVLEAAAASLANQLSDTVFPITVIKVQGNQLYINRGNDGGLKLGDQFIVYQPGEDLVDPQTGEHLGSTETEVGKVKVSRINPKFTVVDVIEGAPADLQEGYILRKPVVQPGANKKASAKKTSAK